MIPKTSVIPPGGHHFYQPLNGVKHRIDGASYTEVAENLLRFRIANKIDVGRPMDELNEYVCGTWPHFCSGAAPQVFPRTSEPAFTIGVLEWTKRLWERQSLNPQPLESEVTANRRAEICSKCPHQKEWADYGCGSCVASVRQQSFVFRAGRTTNRKVSGCSILKQENAAACFASLSVLPDATVAQREALPNHCWRKP
jgi:hypothetical protein